MKLVQIAAAALVALGLGASVSSAADPIIDAPLVSPAFDWTGFYLGVQGGAGVVNYSGTVGAVTATWSAPGFAIGGLVGAQKQIGRWVLGVEGDVSWIGANGTVAPALAVGTSSAQWLATFRGKAGIAADRWLVYGTAGLAVLNNNVSVNGGVQPINNSHLGGVLGLGIDYAVNDRFVIGGGVSYYAFEPKLYNPNTEVNAGLVFVHFLVALGDPDADYLTFLRNVTR